MSPKTDPTQMANRLVRLEDITPASKYAAYFSVSLAPLVAHLGLPIFDGYDDLDLLKFAFLTLPSGETVTLTEYADDLKTSLCVDLKRQQDIPQIIFDSCQKLKISRSEIEWIHKDWRPEIDLLYAKHGEIESIVRPASEEIISSPERQPIECFYYALEIYPRERIPEYWAMLQHNLGLAYYHRTQGERWRNLQESIECFNRSLEVFTEDEFPKKWQINREDLDRSITEWKVEKQNLIRDILDRPRRIGNLISAQLSARQRFIDRRYADLSAEDILDRPRESRNLMSADLSGAKLRDTDLSGANLSGANLRHADLSGAELICSKLRRADLRRADLRGTYLSGADLSGADLSGADLSYAYLIDADLSGADLSGANLRYADLSDANVENTQFGLNLGISELMRQDLMLRGAIFEDLPGDRSSTLTPVGR